MSKPAAPVDQNALLKQEFSLEQSRIGLEKQDKVGNPPSSVETLKSRGWRTLLLMPQQVPPNLSLRKILNKAYYSFDDWRYYRQEGCRRIGTAINILLRRKKVERLSERLTKNTESYADLATLFKAEQSNIKTMQEEPKWKPKTWSG
ncbi:hypothetical protein C8J56DRAFT_1043508 [Mycena floridula]|nr:hypothetical protein C8J56DRAFT_1043508 [Mycena floridula]